MISNPFFAVVRPWAVLCGLSTLALAQPNSNDAGLPHLQLASLTTPANWQRAGGVSLGANQASLKTQPGDKLLVGTPGQPLVLTTQPGDFMLEFEWLASAGAVPTLGLPNGQSLALQHSQLGKVPGLWQRVHLNYKAGQAGKPATLTKLAINGITVQEGQNLTTGKAAGQPVQLNVPSGSVAVRNLGVRPLANRSVANWVGPVSYKFYKKETDKRTELASLTPSKTDALPAIDYNAAYGQTGRFAIIFDGKLNVPTAGDYVFDLNMGGIADLQIDGKPIISPTYHDLGDPETRRVSLTAGTHDVSVLFARSWPRPGLGLFVSLPDTRPQPLHADGSLPEITPVSAMIAQPEARPTLIRSFIQMPGEKTKRTHALSVGNQTGLHYSLDLNQMALLMAWKGDFANVTEMWYERGEPQLLKSAGVTVYPAPRTALAPLANAAEAWPDSLGENVLAYKGLVLDKAGNPTAEYTLAGTTVRDQLRSSAGTLARTLTITGNASSPLYCRLAAGTSVEEVAKGLYAIDDRSYYVRFDPKAPVSVRQSGGKQELIMPVLPKNGVALVSYSIEF